MVKDCIIAVLAAWILITNIPWAVSCTFAQYAVIFLAFEAFFFFFLLFCEEMYKRWMEYRARIKKLEETVARLREGRFLQDEGREAAVHPGEAGKEPGHAPADCQ